MLRYQKLVKLEFSAKIILYLLSNFLEFLLAGLCGRFSGEEQNEIMRSRGS